MDGEDHGINPFSSEELWRISQFTLQSLQPLEALPWNEGLPDLSGGFFKSPLSLLDEDTSKVHQLDIFGTDLFGSSVSSESNADISSDGRESQLGASLEGGDFEDELENIWALENYDDGVDYKTSSRSWERYHNRTFREPISAYFSESGAEAFDAVLAHQARATGTEPRKRIARNDVLFQSLFRLGLGWSSIFFRYNERQKRFERVFNNVRVSGVSFHALDSLTEEILRCGTNVHRVRSFVSKVPTARSTEASALSAFSTAASVIIYTLEKQLVRCYEHIRSLLQIKSLFQRCGELVGALTSMVETIERATSEAQIISVVLKHAVHYSQLYGHMESLFREIGFRVVGPWLTYVESWVGFRSETSTSMELEASGRSFALLEKHEENGKLLKKARVDYTYLSHHMPSFIPEDQAQLIFESGRSLRLLKRSHPEHPLLNGRPRNANFSITGGASTWADLERIQAKASEYETRLRAEIIKYNGRGASQQKHEREETVVDDPANSDENLPGTYDLFDIDDTQNATGLLANDLSSKTDKLGQLLDENANQTLVPSRNHGMDFSPELASCLYLSLAPLLSSQALLIDFSCLHLLFNEHKLRYHLTLQWRFQLLGDGYFTSRLSHALFDPEMESGERKSGVVRSGVHTGLRLGSRDTWPPASSELRLVLIGLLGECYDAGKSLEDSRNSEFKKEKELPGGLSFSIRELTPEEVVKCKNPNAIEALDFLRLQYKPSNVLESIITPRSLDKYDRLFKQLLRLIRMVSVVKSLIRDSTDRKSLSGDTRNILQKFRINCQHFIIAMSDYCFHIGIGSMWRQFQDVLSKIESCLERGDIDGTIEVAHSIPRLRAYHEDTLDQMLFALFLSKRHAEAAKLLEGIFDTILKFAPLSRLDGMSGVRHESEAAIQKLYALFRKQTSAFVGYLRSLDGAKASSKSSSRSGGAFAAREAPTSVFDHLLVRLDMNKYY